MLSLQIKSKNTRQFMRKRHIAECNFARNSFSLSSAGQYLVFDSSNLSQMPLHLWLCKYFLNGKVFCMASEIVRRFESVHGFAFVGNQYQKMHFAGSNPATDPKCPKCIYKISKNFRVRKQPQSALTDWGRRNLSKSPLFGTLARQSAVFLVPASKSDTHHVMCVRFRCKTVCG